MKGKSAPSLLPERRSLRQEFWGQHLGARGYRVCASGNVTEEMSAEYLRPQGAEPQADVRLKVSA
jgi:REP element-mobilizing transposase RayT